MNYEIVTLSEKKAAGIAARTSNADPSMFSTIAGLWKAFYGDGVYASIPGKVNDRALGVYSGYENGAEGMYDMTVCCEVEGDEPLPEGLVSRVIPAGRYAKFVVRGDMQKAVGECWEQIWRLPLDRSFAADFEEYLPFQEGEEPEIHIYIRLKG
ncbi:MAG: AraC family transcriptional regulator [Clostridiales bacterium]|nr:AraC family transcriptional regulator [Clostridiales bacterium]